MAASSRSRGPALAGTAIGSTVGTRLVVGWGFGTAVSVIGMAASAALDLPTGATVVCAFGLALSVFWAASLISPRSGMR